MTANIADANAANSDEDGSLYHYTSLEAFTGIIQTATLWASHIKYLNDTSEQMMLAELVQDQVIETLSRRPNAIPGQWKNFFSKAEDVFVVCFSEDKGDRLSQWRAYGGSCAVCLKFNKEEIIRYFDRLYAGATFQKVRYVPRGGDAYLLEWARKTVALLDSNEIISNIPNRLAIEGAFFKHKAFSEEKEWRAIAIRLDCPLKHRVRGSLLVPYIELNLGKQIAHILEAVIVGPSAHKEQTAQAIEGLLKGIDLDAVKVWCSETPYRGF
jgi:Protein of unknown function (DUF2971)